MFNFLPATLVNSNSVNIASKVTSTVGMQKALFCNIDEVTDHSMSAYCGTLVGSTLAFGSIGHSFESEHRLFSHERPSAFDN